ncbi:proline-rich protein 36 isoform X2 [Ctenocephalides felis]|uniref:proline-rich protein 36 isoform X2 n=1 Tax=Ctenocephalides felis TaxID=7515 RepID=UPI000E6E433F|nr:proline-rich protein 36 isoform X2 [Ctenocephalides felis]
MAMVNMNNLLNGKDSRWLQLEVCREFQRNKCSRPDTECKFAHPPPNVEVQNGRVTACYDSIKGRCNREKPPCKYFHPPQHLKDQLLINGRNHLALKNALMQQMGLAPGQPVMSSQVPTVSVASAGSLLPPMAHSPQGLGLAENPQSISLFGGPYAHPLMTTNPYLTSMQANTYSPYFAPGPLVPALLGPDPASAAVASPLGPVVSQTVAVQQKIPRSDRLESATGTGNMAAVPPVVGLPGLQALPAPPAPSLELGKKRAAATNSDLLLMDMKSVGSFYYESFAFPGMMPYKRPAADKSGMPVYQPGATTYQQLMQLQQPFVPVSCEYIPSHHATPVNTGPTIEELPSTPSHTPTPSQTRTDEQDERAPSLAVVTSSSMPIQDAASIAKEVAQKNYANAVKLAVAASGSLSGKPLSALNYTGVTLNKQPASATLPRFPTITVPTSQYGLAYHTNANATATAAAAYSARPAQPHYPLLRPQLPPHYALTQSQNAAQQILASQGLLAQYHPSQFTGLQSLPALQNLQSIPTLQGLQSLQNLPPLTHLQPLSPAHVAQTPQNAAVVMNPYKKMKTN